MTDTPDSGRVEIPADEMSKYARAGLKASDAIQMRLSIMKSHGVPTQGSALGGLRLHPSLEYGFDEKAHNRTLTVSWWPREAIV